MTANVEVAHWLREVANARIHGTTGEQPAEALKREVGHLQALPAPVAGRHRGSQAAPDDSGGADRATISVTASVAGVRRKCE